MESHEFQKLKRARTLSSSTFNFTIIFLLQMSAVERYAIRFLESSGNYITLEQIKAAKVSKTLLLGIF